MKQNKLRFQGFTDNWKLQELDKLGEFINGNSYKNEKFELNKYDKKEDDVLVIHSYNIKTPKLKLKKSKIQIVNKKENKSNVYLNKNDIVLRIISKEKAGDYGLFSEKIKPFDNYTIGPSCSIFRGKHFFYNRLFETKKYKRLLTYIVEGSTGLKVLKLSELKKAKFFIPNNLQEQERIGNFLANIDRKIELEEKKLEKLEKYKKGMLKKVFSQEVRFSDKNGNKFIEDWKEVKLGDIFEIKSGNLYANNEKKDGEYKFFTCGINILKTNSFDFNGESIIIAGNGANVGNVKYHKNGKFQLAQRTYGLFLKDNNYHVNLIFYKIEKLFRENILSKINSGNIPYIVFKDISTYGIKIPGNKKEQEKIGGYFEKIDKLIEKQKKLIDNNKLFKSGLLQKMF